MKKFVALSLAILLLLSMTTVFPVMAAETTLWTFDNGRGSWTATSPNLNFDTSTAGILAVNITAADAYMSSTVNFSSTYNKIKIRMKNATSATNIQVFYGTSITPGIVGTRVKSFNGALTPNMANYQDVILDMSNVSAWVGTITSLRLDIADNASSGTVYIDSIEILKSSKVAWDFTSSEEGWTTKNKITYDSPVNGILGINISGNDAYMMNPNTDIDSRYNKIKIRLKNETNATLFQVYFTTNVLAMGSTTKKDFATEANMTEFKDFVFDMSNVPTWTNFITQLRLDVADSATSGKVYIDSVQLFFDATSLSAKLSEAQSLNEANYCYGWPALQSAVSSAQELVNKTNLNATEVDNAVIAIDNAIANLIDISLAPPNHEYVNVFNEGFGTALTAAQRTADWIIPFQSNAYMFAGDSLAKIKWSSDGVTGNGTILATSKKYQNYMLETTLKSITFGIHNTLSLRNPTELISQLRAGDSTNRAGAEGIIIVLGGTGIATDEFAIVFKNGQLESSGLQTRSEYKIKYPFGVSITQNTAITIYDLDDKVYIYMDGKPAARIELGGLTGDSYTTGSVYNSKNAIVGSAFTDKVIKREGHIGYSVRTGDLVVDNVTISSMLETSKAVAFDSFDKTAWGTGDSAGNKAKLNFIAGDGYKVNLSMKVDKNLGRSTIAIKDEQGNIVDSKKIDCFFVTNSVVNVTLTVPSKGKYTLEITADGSNYSSIADIEFVEGLGAQTAGNGILFDGVSINEGVN